MCCDVRVSIDYFYSHIWHAGQDIDWMKLYFNMRRGNETVTGVSLQTVISFLSPYIKYLSRTESTDLHCYKLIPSNLIPSLSLLICETLDVLLHEWFFTLGTTGTTNLNMQFNLLVVLGNAGEGVTVNIKQMIPP